MKKVLLVLSLVTSSAFGFSDSPYDKYPMSNDEVAVKIRPVANLQEACDQESRRRGFPGFNQRLQACSFWWTDNKAQDRCLIIVNRTASMHNLGHEMLHCLKGDYHR
jgi:hypothetical protein